MVEEFSTAVRSLWTGRAAIIVLAGSTVNPANGRTVQNENIIGTNIPCRISFNSIKSTEDSNEAVIVAQTVTLYIGKEINVPEGSKITVTQNGVTNSYTQSGKAGVYSSHKEVPLELFKEWA